MVLIGDQKLDGQIVKQEFSVSREDTEMSWNLLIHLKKIQSPWVMAKTDILEKMVLKGFNEFFSGKKRSINNFS
jgi:hypothetical protein